MHPDRRRAGRAIRRQHRLERWDYFAETDAVTDYIASGKFGLNVAAFADAMSDAISAIASIGRMFSEAGKVIARNCDEHARAAAWEREQRRRREFEWRLAHRALTAGER